MNYTKEDIIAALKTVYDPEIPVDVWNLGLIYDIDIKDIVTITMTFTSPTCPMMEELVAMIKSAVDSVVGSDKTDVKLVWSPAWNISMMSDTARLELDLTEQGW